MGITNTYHDAVKLKHRQMKRVGDYWLYSRCEFCGNGLFLGRRDSLHILLPHDDCTMCGQRIQYTDIEYMRWIDKYDRKAFVWRNIMT